LNDFAVSSIPLREQAQRESYKDDSACINPNVSEAKLKFQTSPREAEAVISQSTFEKISWLAGSDQENVENGNERRNAQLGEMKKA